jgi:cell division cycle 20-like protein 1 (cofactor of APC complex)
VRVIFSLLYSYIILNFGLYLQGNVLTFGTGSGCVQVWVVAVRVGAVAWNADVVSSGSRDGIILQRDIRAPSPAVERRLVGHMKGVSRRLFME